MTNRSKVQRFIVAWKRFTLEEENLFCHTLF